VHLRYALSDRAIRLGLKPLVFAAGLVPAALLLWSALTGQFNVNPFNAIVRNTGFWSLRFLCLTLAVTPFRWLTGWHPVVKFRRMFGLFAFFYAAVHVLAYYVFDRVAGLGAPDRTGPVATAALALWAAAVEVVQRPFFAIGFSAFALMVPLAATSTIGMMHRMGGRRWQLVHRLVYPAAIASVVHTYWPLTTRAPCYGEILGVIFALRFARAYSFRERRT
jgi:methionine sulfoxide reductase heme-binding subunit